MSKLAAEAVRETPPPIFGAPNPPTPELSPSELPAVVELIAVRDAEATYLGAVVACLSSTVIHLLALITLSLLVLSIHPTDFLEIQLLAAKTNASSAPQTFIELKRLPFELPQWNEPLPPAAELNLQIKTPRLDSDSGLLAAGGDAAGGNAAGDLGGKPAAGASDARGTFFGAHAYGNRFVYVVDMSTSMGYPSAYGQTRFEVACNELERSINQLNPTQAFCVVMFCYHTQVMFRAPPQMYFATSSNKDRAIRWIRSRGLGPGTDPRYGTMLALQLRPDAIFLLSDGEFNGRSVNAHKLRRNPPMETVIALHRREPIPIHTVALEDVLNRKRLRRISRTTDGTHRFVGRVGRQELLIDDLRSSNLDDVADALERLVNGTQTIHDTQHLRVATKLIGKMLKSPKPGLRKAAHRAMVALADGRDLGPGTDDPSEQDLTAAQRRWKRHWDDHFRERRSGR